VDPNKHYIVAIDGGTQSTKVALFDLAGHEICSHSVKLRPLDLGLDGRAEHPGDDLWDSLTAACRAMLAAFEGDKTKIIGIGLGSIRCCRALLREDGTLAAPIQSWMDRRLSAPYVHDDDAVAYVTTTTGYLTHRMTGQFKDTRANYVGPWPMDPETLDWHADPTRFDSYRTPREMLFELVDPATVLGTLTASASAATGLPEGLAVVATANDKAVEGLGAGLSDDGSVLVSLGTYVTAMTMGKATAPDAQSYYANPGALPGEFLYESGGIRRGMSTVTWITDLLGDGIVKQAAHAGISAEQYLGQIAAQTVPPGSDGLYTVLNWLARPDHSYERGMMIGFNGRHKGPHMFRSILEGMAMTMKNHVQAMCDERGVALSRIVLSGGGSNGDLVMQIFADVFGLPAGRNVVNGSASLGAAICTALALGVYSSRTEAVAHMVRRRDVFAPIPENVALYSAINDSVYKNLASEVAGILQASEAALKASGAK